MHNLGLSTLDAGSLKIVDFRSTAHSVLWLHALRILVIGSLVEVKVFCLI